MGFECNIGVALFIHHPHQNRQFNSLLIALIVLYHNTDINLWMKFSETAAADEILYNICDDKKAFGDINMNK